MGAVLVAFVIVAFGVNAAVRLPCRDVCGSDVEVAPHLRMLFGQGQLWGSKRLRRNRVIAHANERRSIRDGRLQHVGAYAPHWSFSTLPFTSTSMAISIRMFGTVTDAVRSLTFTRSGLPDHADDLAAGGSANDGIVHQHHSLSLQQVAHGIQLQLHTEITNRLRWLDERAAHVVISD